MSKELTLYAMSQEMVALIEADEVSDELLSAAIGNIEKKGESACHFIRNVENAVDTFKAEEKRIAARRKAMENTIDRVKQYIKDCMEVMGAEKITAGTFTLRIQNNPAALEITDEVAIPNSYLVVIPATTVPDKERIKTDLKAGKEIPGAVLTVGRSLRIC